MDTNKHRMIDDKPLTAGEISLIRALRKTYVQIIHSDGGITPFNRCVVCFEVPESNAAEHISFLLRKIRHEQEHELIYGDSR